MGGVRSITNMYSYNQYLYFYINKNNVNKIEEILALRPQLIRDPLTLHSKVTALNQAIYKNNIELAKLLIDKYEADVNLSSLRGETPLITAIKRNHIKMVEFLIEKGANPNYVDKTGLSTIDYAILQGLYEISFLIYNIISDKQFKSEEEYKDIGKKFSYRYVNYALFLKDLQNGVDPQNTSNFLIKKRSILSDPVIDPNQTWKQWFMRNLDFKDPPLVQRSSLPEHLHPENRRFGKFGNFMSRMTMTPSSQKPEYESATKSENLEYTGQKISEMMREEIEMQSVN